MTLTENLDLRAQMVEAAGLFDEAIQLVMDEEFKAAAELWIEAQKVAQSVKHKLVRANLEAQC